MSFLDIQSNTIYLKIDANAKIIRPLAPKPIGKWVHQIPACSVVRNNKQTQLRQFKYVDAEFTRYLKDNPDPLWDKLTDLDRFNRNGDRQDFPLRPQHILPVWSYADNDVKCVKQGNMFYEEMVKYSDQGGDVTACDWVCWSEGSGRTVKYKTSRRDASPFTCSASQEVLAQKSQAIVQQALSDLRPFKNDESLVKFILGQTTEEAASSQFGANTQQQLSAPQQPQMPAYIPGGTVLITHGSPAVAVQQQQPIQQFQQQAQVFQPAVQQPIMQPYVPQQAPYIPQQAPIYNPSQAYSPQQQMPQNYPPPMATTQVPRIEVPNAPVTSAPVFAPPAPVQSQPPVQPQSAGVPPFQVAVPVNGAENYLIDFGKHKGKTLGWIRDNAGDYLPFLKGNKRELAPIIDQLMGGNTQVTITPPPAPQQGQTQVNPDNEEQRLKLVKELNLKIMGIEEFRGTGIHERMMPFIEGTIGTKSFSDAPMDKLLILKAAVDQKVASV